MTRKKGHGRPGPGGARGGHARAGHGGRAGHGHHGPGHEHGGHGRDPHGNPADLARYLARLDDPERAGWQRPDEVVAALGLRPGDTVGEVGAGSGYFTLRLARAVGPEGRVLAAEVSTEIMAVLRSRLAEAQAGNVEPLLAQPEAPPFPARSCQRILIVNTFHHFPDGAAYLRALSACLAPGGRIANVDFHERELPVGPPPELKISREEFLEVARQAGLVLVEERAFLPHQYFVLLRKR
ncbi:MAG: methyltransferase domain-containing protein [Deltaproteobacteria bacterium]|nr:methyltransferase domain-containing protein [Deltaproteobacteria bacterium]